MHPLRTIFAVAVSLFAIAATCKTPPAETSDSARTYRPMDLSGGGMVHATKFGQQAVADYMRQPLRNSYESLRKGKLAVKKSFEEAECRG